MYVHVLHSLEETGTGTETETETSGFVKVGIDIDRYSTHPPLV